MKIKTNTRDLGKPQGEYWKNLGVFKKLPQDVSFLSKEPDDQKALQDIHLLINTYSGHVCIEESDLEGYYDDYLMTTTYSQKMQDLQAAQAKRLASLYDGTPSSFVEIGCGDGSFMQHISALVPKAVGYEPSERFAKEALDKGFEVINSYVTSKIEVQREPFDLFASRQVFEHLHDPLDTLRGIRKMLHNGSVGLIEVPNGYYSLQQARFFDYFPDHIQYYSVNSLVELAGNAGFNVIACHESFGGDYLECWMQVMEDPCSLFNTVVNARDNVVKALCELILELKSRHQKVAIWGCGAKTVSIGSVMPKEILKQVEFVIDSDPHKHGRYLPNSEVGVVAPHVAEAIGIDAIIILALSYVDEIATIINDRIPGCTEVYTVGRKNMVIKL